jgi:hypothetical protein
MPSFIRRIEVVKLASRTSTREAVIRIHLRAVAAQGNEPARAACP